MRKALHFNEDLLEHYKLVSVLSTGHNKEYKITLHLYQAITVACNFNDLQLSNNRTLLHLFQFQLQTFSVSQDKY